MTILASLGGNFRHLPGRPWAPNGRLSRNLHSIIAPGGSGLPLASQNGRCLRRPRDLGKSCQDTRRRGRLLVSTPRLEPPRRVFQPHRGLDYAQGLPAQEKTYRFLLLGPLWSSLARFLEERMAFTIDSRRLGGFAEFLAGCRMRDRRGGWVRANTLECPGSGTAHEDGAST